MKMITTSSLTGTVNEIKKIMIDRDINQKQLSQMVGVTPSQLSKLFKGRCKFGFGLLAKVASALGYSFCFTLLKTNDEHID